MSATPNPGSLEAIELGCTCPRVDNGRGRGSGRFDQAGNPMFWVNGGCPLHVNPPMQVGDPVSDQC